MASLPGRNPGQSKKLKRLAYAFAQHDAAQAEANANKPEPAPGWASTFATLGLLDQQDEPPAQVEYLWPCNVKHWAMWCELHSQWRIGMGGATGLDYAAAIAHLRAAHNLRGKRLQKAWDAMRACEQGTLQAWSEDAKRKKDSQPKNAEP